ncbi:MAG: PD40 domain-containing protein [Sporocytophaga sp.]|uniref:OmpA family protein n=1 Tax=Sporocytophaga sp. TaxID=2231183 RepID=UPI001B17001C|nr:OmpA family protein [Sporocytophaga sp.]MBO9699183.1 PD40 domain-containing protein [Sporocytophaga sp.]
MKKLCFFIICLSFSLMASVSVQAQGEKKLIKEAEAALIQKDKKKALDLYLKAWEINPNKSDVNYKIGILYLESDFKFKALPYLEKASSLGLSPDYQINKYLGIANQLNHNFEKAIENYQNYKASITDKEEIKKVDRRIYECNNGLEFISNPVPVKIDNLGPVINSSFPEYAPVISADDSLLIFTSRRQGSTGGATDQSGMYFEDLYSSKKIEGGWSIPQNLGFPVNTSSHEASVGISPDGNQLFIYKDNGNGDIYACSFSEEHKWSKPVSVGSEVNSAKYFENGACLSFDGKKFFFASNREGGAGGNDIWVVEKKDNGSWGKPSNLGIPINTDADEESPFMDLDGKTLYFSSRAHKGMGGFDIFKSVFSEESKKWSIPENLGYPINSADNDLYFILSGDGRHGYYASVKEGGYGDKDIYRISMPPRSDFQDLQGRLQTIREKRYSNQSVAKNQSYLFSGKVLDSGTNKPVSNALVKLKDNKGNVISEITSSSAGDYHFKIIVDSADAYLLTAYVKGYGPFSKDIEIPKDKKTANSQVNDINLKKLNLGERFVLRNIYFDFDKSELKPESKSDLENLIILLNDNPSVSIEIAGYTDSKGEKEYNQNLSQKRAEAVLNYLVSRGISKKRLVAKGYGESTPVNNGQHVKEEEASRRTEFVIIDK